MKKCLFTCLLSMLLAQSGFALLSPLSESLVELKTLLEDPRLQKSFGEGEAVQSIERTNEGYLVQTNKSKLNVDLIYRPMNRIGPQQFEFHFNATEQR